MKDIFNYSEYWNSDAIKRRKGKNMYEKNEVEEVLGDVAVILDRFIDRIETALESLEYSLGNINSVEAVANLSIANDKLKKIDLVPVIDTIQGILEAEVEDD